MNTPKVSVIIPTYKGREHLGDAIQSVLDQTYQNFELLVVNDASPDDTAGVMARFNDPRIKYKVHERNLGVGQARRTGIHASHSEIIAFLDHDDYFHPENQLALHMKFHEQHPRTS